MTYEQDETPVPPEMLMQRLAELEAEAAEQPVEEAWLYEAPEDDELPFVSVVIAVRNEEGFIARCLHALSTQDYPRDRYEVIVVDGQSTDGTAAEVREMVMVYGLPETFKTNPRQTTATGRNLGIASAAGDVIILVDGHTRVDKSFISASVKALQDSHADCAGGPITTRGHGVVGRAIALAMASPFGVGDASFRTLANDADARAIWTDSVAFGAYRRDVFARLGGFAEDVDYGEDDEFNYRLRESGGRILLSPAIKATYYCRDSLDGLLRQYWRYGLAKAEVLHRHPQRLRPRHLVPSALVVALGGGALLGMVRRRFALIAVLAGGAYAAANAIATLRIARDGNEQEERYLPLAFAAMHFGAGAGMLAGFWRILTRRKEQQHDRRD